MARTPKPPEKRQANLSWQQMEAAIPAIDRRLADLEAFNPNTVNDRSDARIGALTSKLGSGLIDYSQKMTMAAMQIADMNV